MDIIRAQELLEKSAARIDELFNRCNELEQQLGESRNTGEQAVAEVEVMKVAMSLVEANQTAPYESWDEMMNKAASYMQKQAGEEPVVLKSNFIKVPSMGKVANRPSLRSGSTANERFVNSTARIFYNEE